MVPFALALLLFLADQPAAAEAPAAAPAEAAAPASEAPPPEASAADAPPEAPWPTGAPRDDYQLVAWCYGVLRGYLDMHDEVMPEVTRIEREFRRPGSSLEADLKVYDDQMAQGRKDLARFQAALTAAEKASLRPINTVGAAAVRKGRSVWNAGPEVSKARKAQEWMSWALPSRCSTTADTLEQKAKLMGTAFKVNEEPAPEAEAPATTETPAAEPAPAPAEQPSEAPPSA
jgi:hypothetical protein